jgi:hypothetical protein
VRVGNGSYTDVSSAGSDKLYVVIAGSTTTETVLFYANSWIGTIDNVVVTKAESDRAITQQNTGGWNYDLGGQGPITKSAVATGAELMAYSGFTSSIYFEQPYNSNFNFGTGDWCISGWVYPNSTQNGSTIFTWGTSGGPYIYTYFNSDKLRIDLKDDSASSYHGITSNAEIREKTSWFMFHFIRRGSNVHTYVNGVLDDTAALNSNSSGSYTNTSGIVRIGYNGSAGSPMNTGKLSLIRVSKTAPTQEQITYMYNEEKDLFLENAKCSLNGTSSVVTDVVYDDSTELLHVGTSTGRSTFQGLRRVEENTNAITVLAAQGGMVVEEY